MNPAAVCAGNNTLSAKHRATAACIQSLQRIFNISNSELTGSFYAPGSKHLVGVVMIVMIVAAGAMTFIVMMMVMFMVVVAAATMLLIVVLMLMVVMATAAMLLIVVMVMMFVVVMTAAAMLLLVMMVMMFVIVMTAAAMFFFVMVMMFLLHTRQLSLHRSLAFHRLQQLLTGKLIPRRSYDGSILIMLP